jgi:hypothetical protein
MTQLPSLKYSHTSGGLAIHSKSSSLICLSGSKCKTVEKYTDELLIKGYGKKKSKGDTSEMQWNNLPELSYDRANAGYVVVNDYLYAFFGYSASSNKSLHSIERLDLSKDYIGSYFEWDIIKYNRGDGVSMNLQGFICVDSKDENEIIIVGGQAGSLYNDKIISFNNTSKNLVVKGKFDIRNASFTQMKNTVPSNDAKTYFLVDDDNDLIKYDSSSNQFNIV